MNKLIILTVLVITFLLVLTNCTTTAPAPYSPPPTPTPLSVPVPTPATKPSPVPDPVTVPTPPPTPKSESSKPSISLPSAGFIVEHTRSNPNRPVRQFDKEYTGPIIDTHAHLDPPGSGNINQESLIEIVEAVDKMKDDDNVKNILSNGDIV